jgi:hypothetical protein
MALARSGWRVLYRHDNNSYTWVGVVRKAHIGYALSTGILKSDKVYARRMPEFLGQKIFPFARHRLFLQTGQSNALKLYTCSRRVVPSCAAGRSAALQRTACERRCCCGKGPKNNRLTVRSPTVGTDASRHSARSPPSAQ